MTRGVACETTSLSQLTSSASVSTNQRNANIKLSEVLGIKAPKQTLKHKPNFVAVNDQLRTITDTSDTTRLCKT